jgi:hypothetical protein
VVLDRIKLYITIVFIPETNSSNLPPRPPASVARSIGTLVYLDRTIRP